MAAGLLAFSSRQFALTIKHGLFFVRFTIFFLPEQANRVAYAARGAKRLVLRINRLRNAVCRVSYLVPVIHIMHISSSIILHVTEQ